MRTFPWLILLFVVGPLLGQAKKPPAEFKAPPPEQLAELNKKFQELKQAVGKAKTALEQGPLSAKGASSQGQADLEIYVKAIEWQIKHNEFLNGDTKQALSVIEQGLARCQQAQTGKRVWLEKPAGTWVPLGYISKIDGSVQPFALAFPPDYGKDPQKKYRLDVVLHGRDGTLCETKFLATHAQGKPAPKDVECLTLEVYGRGNNAYRWAGEIDVLEATTEAMKFQVDPKQIVLRGFSMGGAGTWHIGLRRPFFAAVLQPGAGFTTTHGYVGALPALLPSPVEETLRIYDAILYAENAFNVPIVAYSGEKDGQKKAADNIEARLKELGLSERMTHLIAPGLEHQFPPAWKAKTDAEIAKLLAQAHEKPKPPKEIRFTTYSVIHGEASALQILSLEQEYDQALVVASLLDDLYTLKTKNIASIKIHFSQGKRPKAITLDGQKFENPKLDPDTVIFSKVGGQWTLGRLAEEKFKGVTPTGHILSGPIDHAFMDKFVCVIGNDAEDSPALIQFRRFEREWEKWMRGKLPTLKASEIKDPSALFAQSNVILFGTPASNPLISRILPQLPFLWTEKEITWRGKSYDAKTHLPMLIYPNGSGHYVVLNSGHTFHEADFKGTNALLYPRLGDFALVRPKPSEKEPAQFEIIESGLFDRNWKFPKPK